MSSSAYKRDVAYSVPGQGNGESMDGQGEKFRRPIPLVLDQVNLLKGAECRSALCGEYAESQLGKRVSPSRLLSPSQASPRSRMVTKDKGLSVWVPGAHRSPTGRTMTPPPRTPTPLSSCDRHGKMDTRNADLSCDRCLTIFLEESTVSPRSDLVKGRSVPAYCLSSYALAAEGKCTCRPLQRLFCSPCKARAQISAEIAVHVGSTWDWV